MSATQPSESPRNGRSLTETPDPAVEPPTASSEAGNRGSGLSDPSPSELTVDQVAVELGSASRGAAYRWLRVHRVPVVGVQPTYQGGTPRNLYSRAAVLAARTDQQRRARARRDMGQWKRGYHE